MQAALRRVRFSEKSCCYCEADGRAAYSGEAERFWTTSPSAFGGSEILQVWMLTWTSSFLCPSSRGGRSSSRSGRTTFCRAPTCPRRCGRTCPSCMVAFRDDSVLDKGGAGVPAAEFLRMLANLKDEPDTAAFRWGLMISDSN